MYSVYDWLSVQWNEKVCLKQELERRAEDLARASDALLALEEVNKALQNEHQRLAEKLHALKATSSGLEELADALKHRNAELERQLNATVDAGNLCRRRMAFNMSSLAASREREMQAETDRLVQTVETLRRCELDVAGKQRQWSPLKERSLHLFEKPRFPSVSSERLYGALPTLRHVHRCLTASREEERTLLERKEEELNEAEQSLREERLINMSLNNGVEEMRCLILQIVEGNDMVQAVEGTTTGREGKCTIIGCIERWENKVVSFFCFYLIACHGRCAVRSSN